MKHLKELRENKNLNQQGLAILLNASQSTISFYETGERTPDVANLIKMSEIFDCSVDYLLDLTEIKQPLRKLELNELSKEELELLLNYRDLTRDSKNKVMGFIIALMKEKPKDL